MNNRGARTKPRTTAAALVATLATVGALIAGATVSGTTQNQANITTQPYHTELIMPADPADRSAILENYRSQHRAMIEGRTDVLAELLADQFTATHITGYEQPKAEWLAQIRSGDFSYHRIEEHEVSITVDGDTAVLVGEAQVTVTINGGRGTWPLRSTMHYVKQHGSGRSPVRAPPPTELRLEATHAA